MCTGIRLELITCLIVGNNACWLRHQVTHTYENLPIPIIIDSYLMGMKLQYGQLEGAYTCKIRRCKQPKISTAYARFAVSNRTRLRYHLMCILSNLCQASLLSMFTSRNKCMQSQLLIASKFKFCFWSNIRFHDEFRFG